MSSQPLTAGGERAWQRFTLYAAGGRIYVQNDRSVLIEIGHYERDDDGFSYAITHDASLGDSGFAGADDILRDLAGRIDLPFLDIRFRTLPDHAEDYSVDFRRAAHCAVLLRDTGDVDLEPASQPSARSRRSAVPAL